MRGESRPEIARESRAEDARGTHTCVLDLRKPFMAAVEGQKLSACFSTRW